MTNTEAADALIELYARFTYYRFSGGREVERRFSEAIALACMALKEEKSNG